ncbi:hypothetical protein ACNKHX_21865 [Shigella flexneri]
MNPIEMASKSWDEIIAKLEKMHSLKRSSSKFIRKVGGENITDAIVRI